jgi:hypothetical protein
LKQSQELNGALEAANQQLGGEPGVDQGESGQTAQLGQEGEGEGEVMMVGQGPKAGDGHTWEDEGTHETTEGHQDANRLSDRTTGEEIDDYEAFYAPVHMAGTEGAITGVAAEIDESGRMETFSSRLTEADEQATTPLLDVPDGYRDAAERAMENERVPPGYRAAVREYFESTE